MITVNMLKARDIQRDKMRIARKPKLEALDVDFQRAIENDDATEKASIVAQKQALRDVTQDPAIESATTPDELKAVWPEILN